MSWKDWVGPSAILAVLALGGAYGSARLSAIDNQYGDVGRRITELDSKLDRRIDALTGRFDAILQQQGTLTLQLGLLQSEISYVKNRLDKIADKLQVTKVEPTGIPATAARPQPNVIGSPILPAYDPALMIPIPPRGGTYGSVTMPPRVPPPATPPLGAPLQLSPRP